MIPTYIYQKYTKPVDILFLNLSNVIGNPVYPYAFVQVSAMLRQADLSVIRWDGIGLNGKQQLDCIEQLVLNHHPKAVFFTIRQADSTIADDYLTGLDHNEKSCFPMEDIYTAIQRIRRISPAIIVIGGFGFTVNPGSAAKYLQPDIGIVGEPDDLIAHFHKILQGQTHGVDNLLYYQNGQWHQNKRVFYGPLIETEYTTDIIDEIISFHGERLIREAHLAPVPGLGSADNTGLSIAIEISRGCPCHCTFCCEPEVKGHKVRLRCLDVIEDEIQRLLHYGLRYYWFVCSELNFCKNHILALAERLIDINQDLSMPIYWRAYLLPVKFTKNELRILLRSGMMLEQNESFTDLYNETLKKMNQPYRVKHALEHIQKIMELNEESEFAHRKISRWPLWSWLANPYAGLDSVQQTLKQFSQYGLDLKYDMAKGYPALRVYECLQNLPKNVNDFTKTITKHKITPESLVHPSFYYNQELLNHFGSINALNDFIFYAHETLLSRHYRITRNWTIWSLHQDETLLSEVMQKLEIQPLPEWVDHPDLGNKHPQQLRMSALWYWKQASENWSNFTQKIAVETPARQNALISALLHQGFSHQRDQWLDLFIHLKLCSAEKNMPTASPYFAIVAILSQGFSTKEQLIDTIKYQYSPEAILWFEYYYYALNINLYSSLNFLIF
jgi:hypothetical protein